MKKFLSLMVLSTLVIGSVAQAEMAPTSGQINRYYSAIAGLEVSAIDKKDAGTADYETDVEMMEALRQAQPNLNAQDFMKEFFAMRLLAIKTATEENSVKN